MTGKTNFEILNDFLFQLSGNCFLLYVGDSEEELENMKDFVLVHFSTFNKFKDFKKIKQFLKSEFANKCNNHFITIPGEKEDGFKSILERKALSINFI